jgi:quercetin dioxygenase-like cupin family protein
VTRIVTGTGEDGRAAILFSGEPTTRVEFGKYRTTELWVTSSSPPEAVRDSDPSERPWELEPPVGGTCFRIVEIAPDSPNGAAASPTESAGEPADFLAEHTTDTLDYVVVLSGEVTLRVGEAEVTLHPGDSVVQQGVAHDWRNDGTQPCLMAGVLMSTQSRLRLPEARATPQQATRSTTDCGR